MDDIEVIAHAGALLSDPLRLRILAELQQVVLTVSELTARLDASQPRVSAQLATLRDAGWVEVMTQGRQRYYRLAAPQITVAMVELAALPAPHVAEQPADARLESAGGVEPELRIARSCYDHLAGVAGVHLHDTMLEQGWLEPTAEGIGRYQPAYALTQAGERELTSRGVELPSESRRRFAFACPDWTEARPHLGGSLAAAIFSRLQEDGYLKRRQRTRALQLEKNLAAWLVP